MRGQTTNNDPGSTSARAGARHPVVGGVSDRRERRSDWRKGGRAVRKWRGFILSVALISAGVGVLGYLLVERLILPSVPVLSTVVLWIALSAAVGTAVLRSRPAGLFVFRARDLVWGLGVGIVLRVVQGFVESANAKAFPTLSAPQSWADLSWIVSLALPYGVIGPLVEELFFRAVILVSVHEMFRRWLGRSAAGVIAALVSSGAFVLLHTIFAPLNFASAIQLVLLGFVCSLTVLLTGRIWSAVLAHATYNCTFLVLLAVGTVLMA